ncbi:MFS transporter [Maritalea porphyrae]|uniref:MFS transporter n=1 Tax=Maritalea porphyrae TaxID=880732 RepID=UPI0022AFDF55|nr:MFS transporter [Maritalea porphyrae]MCZ4271670.1 MFS transporter [Maritalea porphyrae]
MAETHSTPKPSRWSDLAEKGHLAYSVLFAGSVALHAVNVFISITIMPTVVRDIGGLGLYAWSSTVFIASSILSAALTSQLLGLLGIKGAYISAVGIFILGTTLCAAAPDIWTLILGRAIQGGGGGFFYALSYAVIRLVYPKPLWPLAIGLISAMWGVATLLGPAIGGVFAQIQAWRMAFWVLIPFATAIGGLALISLPSKRVAHDRTNVIPFAQLLLLLLIVLSVSIGSINTTVIKAIFALAMVVFFGGALVFFDRTLTARLLPAGSFSLKSSLGARYLYVALIILAMQVEIFVPFFLIRLHGLLPIWAGFIGAFMALGWTAGSMLTANWQGLKVRVLFQLGPLICAIGLLLQGLFLPQLSDGHWINLAPICFGLLGIGFGIGVSWPHIVVQIYNCAPAKEHDLAAGGITTVQLFATAFGAALAGMVVNLAGLSNTISPLEQTQAASALCLTFLAFPIACVFVARGFSNVPKRKSNS